VRLRANRLQPIGVANAPAARAPRPLFGRHRSPSLAQWESSHMDDMTGGRVSTMPVKIKTSAGSCESAGD
jgi:hypothetical protein